ncbi:ankyrin repeat protein, partial [Morchella snyderi]
GHVNVVQHLLDRGVSMIDPTPWTGIENPLHIAAREGQLSVVYAMLKHEDAAAASLLTDSHGYTPFHLAALNGFTSVLRLFLETAAVDVNLRSDRAITQHAATALHYAASWGHDKAVKQLLRAG